MCSKNRTATRQSRTGWPVSDRAPLNGDMGVPGTDDRSEGVRRCLDEAMDARPARRPVVEGLVGRTWK